MDVCPLLTSPAASAETVDMDAGTSICETAEDLDARTVVLLSRTSRNPVQNMLFESANTYCVRPAAPSMRSLITSPVLLPQLPWDSGHCTTAAYQVYLLSPGVLVASLIEDCQVRIDAGSQLQEPSAGAEVDSCGSHGGVFNLARVAHNIDSRRVFFGCSTGRKPLYVCNKRG